MTTQPKTSTLHSLTRGLTYSSYPSSSLSLHAATCIGTLFGKAIAGKQDIHEAMHSHISAEEFTPSMNTILLDHKALLCEVDEAAFMDAARALDSDQLMALGSALLDHLYEKVQAKKAQLECGADSFGEATAHLFQVVRISAQYGWLGTARERALEREAIESAALPAAHTSSKRL